MLIDQGRGMFTRDKKSLWIRTGIAAALLTVAMLMALVAATDAMARVGALDPAFGEGGKLGPRLEKYGGAGAMAVGPDGSIVLVEGGDFVRLLPNGEPDPAFGDGGRVEIPARIEGFGLSISDVAVDSKGRLLVAGTLTDMSRLYLIPSSLSSFPASWTIVLRLTAGGELDPSFGEGRGFVRGDFGLHPGPSSSPSEPDFPAAVGLALRVDSRDRPVLLVGTPDLFAPCWGHSGVSTYPRAVVRLNEAGSADAEFGGGDGIVPLDGLAPSPEVVLALDGADRPIVGSGEGGACPHRGIVFRLAADGSPLAGFGVDGARRYARRYLAAVAPSGAMVLRGIEDEVWLQVNPDGRPDRGFGKDGEVPHDGLPGRWLQPVGVDAQGRILVTGSLQLPKVPEGGRVTPSIRRKRRGFLVVYRLLPDGRLDRSFGNQGRIVTPIGPHLEVTYTRAVLDPQGRLVVLGNVNLGFRKQGFVLARYLLDGDGTVAG